MKKIETEVIFTHNAPHGALSVLARKNKARKLGPRLYTTNMVDPLPVIARRNVWTIVAGYFPDAIIADRTAFELAPASDGSVFFIATQIRKLDVAGLKLRPRTGHGRLDGDFEFRSGLLCSSMARAYLDNMRLSRGRTTVARTLSRRELESRLERFVRNSGEDAFNRMRDAITELAPRMGMEKEAITLSSIIGTLLGTRDESLTDGAAIARAGGEPIDQRRLDLFDNLHDALRSLPPLDEATDSLQGPAFITRAFFEAYFSNFIEGTEFELGEAEQIVFHGIIPRNRPKDGHDILGTYRLVSDRKEQARPITSEDHFLQVLQERHAFILGGRPEFAPGAFKETVNRAGATVFVHPDAVKGTLKAGFRMIQRLDDPFQRAAAMMFVVAEVHPFNDGNGRLARAMMNAELLRAHHSPIIVPTVYRDNYLAALKRLTHHGDPDAYIRMLMFAHRYGRGIPWANRDLAIAVLNRTHAFDKANEAEERGFRLKLPTADDVVAAQSTLITA